MTELLVAAFVSCALGALLALLRASVAARALIGLGAAAGVAYAITALPHGGARIELPVNFADQGLRLRYDSEALWLMGFGLVPAALAAWLCTPAREYRAGWLLGAALSILGALGVYGVQDGYSFLIAWELMSLGGAAMILSERLSDDSGHSALFMLALLEVGAIAILLALLLLARQAGGSLDFAAFAQTASSLAGGTRVWVGVLLLIGFGAKLGLLPFYEWFPGAYGSGSGASGAIMSGVVLNAAFFALSRGLVGWLAGGEGLFELGVLVTAVAVLSSILAVLYAFQQDDWRRLLAFSSAENAAIAVTGLGACLIFRADGQHALAGLAWTVALLHLAGHALAKGGLFLCADGVFRAGGDYELAQRGWLRRAGLPFGIGALFTAMSLAAMPPQIGFVTEWFTFQTLFQGFHLSALTGRLTLALAGAGMALTAAIAFATFVKVLGIGLLGAAPHGAAIRGGARSDGAERGGTGRLGAATPGVATPGVTTPGVTTADVVRSETAAPGAATLGAPAPGVAYGGAVLLLGLAVFAAAVGMPVWLAALDEADWLQFGVHSATSMSADWLLVPLTNSFAFISPSKLAIVMPLLAILPLLLLINLRRHAIRRVPVWFGGLRENPQRAATTSLTFANAMRTFYSFIYRPTLDTAREHRAVAYFIRKLELTHDVADVFGPLLFAPIRQAVWRLARWMRSLQSGDLNFYLALIGALLILILALTLR